jgi:uridine kinase
MEANRLLAFLQWFEPLAEEDTAVITSVSILREFIGGSILNDYEPH